MGEKRKPESIDQSSNQSSFRRKKINTLQATCRMTLPPGTSAAAGASRKLRGLMRMVQGVEGRASLPSSHTSIEGRAGCRNGEDSAASATARIPVARIRRRGCERGRRRPRPGFDDSSVGHDRTTMVVAWTSTSAAAARFREVVRVFVMGKNRRQCVFAGYAGCRFCLLGLTAWTVQVYKTLTAGTHWSQDLILWGGFAGSFKNPPRLHP